MKSVLRRYAIRRENGALGGLLFSAGLISILGLGAFALDLAHMLAVRSELQNAVDAAALAGAQAFANDDDENAEANALAVAAQNTADGRAISNESPATQLTVDVSPAVARADPNVVRVDAQMTVRHMLAPIFGRQNDIITAQSRAGAYQSVKVLAPGQAFPVAVNPRHYPNGLGGNGKPVNELKKGDPVTLIIRPSGNPGRNAVWTPYHIASANTRTYEDLIQMYLEQIPNDPTNGIPELEAGVTEINLDNGVNRGTHVDSIYHVPLQNKPFIIFPLVNTDNYNQHTTVIGFITVKVTDISYIPDGLKFEGTMEKHIVKGWAGALPATGDPAVQENSPWIVKLLSNDAA